MRPSSSSERNSRGSVSLMSRNQYWDSISPGRELWKSVLEGNLSLAVSIGERMLNACTDMNPRVHLLKMIISCSLSMDAQSRCESYLRELEEVAPALGIGIRAKLHLRSGHFHEVDDLYNYATEFQPDARNAVLPVYVLSSLLQGHVEKTQALLETDESISEDDSDSLKSLLCFVKGIPDEPSLDTVNNILLRFHQSQCHAKSTSLLDSASHLVDPHDIAIINDLRYICTGPSMKCPETPVSRFNNRVLFGTDDSEILAYLEKRVDAMKPPKALDEWNLHDFAVCNLLILYSKNGEFDKAYNLIQAADTRKLQDCFSDPNDWLRLRLFVELNINVHSEKAIEELDRIISELVDRKAPATSLGKFVGILARHLYDRQKYDELETLHSRMGHVFNTSPDWTINIANASFAQKKYETACKYYESVVLGTKESLLVLSPAILANLCVCWLESDQNDRAEQLMTDVHELEVKHDNHIHSTIINLVIGYLYCSKGNFEFGMDRVMESLKEERNMQSETWFYCKSVFMTLTSAAASGTGPHLADNFIDRMVSFLETISAIKAPIASDQPDQTIQKEAEIILRLINKLYCD